MPQQREVRGHYTSVHTEGGQTRVVYHKTCVVRFDDKQIRLNSNGWKTATTKTHMNQASNQFGFGFYVKQVGGVWYVEYKGREREYSDGMVLDR